MKRMTSLVALLLLVLCSCTNSGATVRALKNQGFTDIRPGGYAWFACSGDDMADKVHGYKSTRGARKRNCLLRALPQGLHGEVVR